MIDLLIIESLERLSSRSRDPRAQSESNQSSQGQVIQDLDPESGH